jgi:hypothetical protein
LGALQIEYTVVKIGISDYRISRMEETDGGILSVLLKIFSLNLVKFLDLNEI